MTDQVEILTVRDLFEKRIYNSKRCITLENLTKSYTQDDITNYVEVVTGKGLIGVCNGSGIAQGNVMVAILEEDLEDISSVKARPLKGNKISFNHLGHVAGIVVIDIGLIPEETIELYFESPKRSGVKKDAVEQFKFYSLEFGKVAIASINDVEAIEGILSRPSHVVSSQKLDIEPYFPAFHDVLIEFLKQSRNNEKDKRKFPLEKRNQENTSYDQDLLLCQRKTQLSTDIKSESESKQTLSAVQNNQEPQDKNPQPTERKAVVSKKPLMQVLPYQLTELSSKQTDCMEIQGKNRLTIICDDEDDHQFVSQTATPTAAISARQLPIVEQKHHKVERNTIENECRQVKARRKSSSESKLDQQRACVTEKQFSKDIPNISRAKIVLLKIGHFQDKCKQAELDVDVVLVEKNPTVTLKSNSQTEIQEAKLIMHEILHSVVIQTLKILPKQRADYLSRTNIQDCLRFKLKNEKIRAVFEMNMDTLELVCYGFNEENVRKGVELLGEMFLKETIKLREGQLQLLQSPGWVVFCENKSSSAMTIYEADGNIVIESLKTVKREKIKDVRSAIIEFLKTNAPKHTAVIEMSGGKAEYFEKYCMTDLENQMRNKQVSLQTQKTKLDRPIKIQLTLEGESNLIEDIKKGLQNIWHEKVDFKHISTDSGDVWQIMRCLDGDIGKEFFRGFQKANKCVVEVVRDGEIQPPSIRIIEHLQNQHEEWMPHEAENILPFRQVDHVADYSPDTDDELEAIVSPDGAAQNSLLASQEKLFQEYQHGISQWDATAIALEQSLEESRSFENMSPGLGAKSRFQNVYNPLPETQYYNARRYESISHPSSRMVGAPTSETESQSTNEIVLGNTRVVLSKGTITNQKADVLVNIVDTTGEFPGKSIVAQAFVNKGGPALVQQFLLLKQRRNFVQNCRYITVTGEVGNLNCKAVFHVELKKKGQVEEVIPEVMSEVYNECARRGYTSISFPPLGVGRLYNYPAQELAHAMLTETERMSVLQEVQFVIYQSDSETYKVFHKAFDQHKRLGHDSRMRFSSAPVADISHVRQQTVRNKLSNFSAKMDQNNPSAANQVYRRQCREPQYASRYQESSYERSERFGNRSCGRSFPTVDRNERGPQRGTGMSEQGTKNNRRNERIHSDGQQNRQMHEVHRKRLSRGEIRNEKSEKTHTRKPVRESRFSREVPVSMLTVTVFAGSKENCERLRNDMAKKIRDKFLFFKEIQKVKHVSEGAKKKIVQILEQLKVKSLKRSGGYILKGYKENVIKAYEFILKLLLNDRPTDAPIERRQKESRAKRATVDYARDMAVEDAEVPDYWKNYKSGEVVKNIIVDLKQFFTKKKFEQVVLDENGHTFKTIIKLINETFKVNSDKIGHGNDAKGIQPYGQFFVLKIVRIENIELYGEYIDKRSNLFRKLLRRKLGYFKKLHDIEGVGKCEPCKTSCLVRDRDLASDIKEEVNECFCFHGTKLENVDKICSEGPDYRLCSAEAMFGQGIYGAESVIKADQYTDDQSSRTMGRGHPKKIFLMRMLLGEIYVCKTNNPHKYKRAPCTTCYMDICKKPDHEFKFDSVVGDVKGKNFREFVVYDSRQCYPEYLITYERR